MIKQLSLFGVVLAFSLVGFTQEIEKAPKYMSLEIGQRYLASSSFDMKAMGTTLEFDYTWQLSGYSGKPAGYISIPIGYTYFYSGQGDKTGGILSYGWAVRHDLKANQKNIPFFGYGLLLNQLRLNGVKGSSFGHQTRFDFGYVFNDDKNLSPFLKVEYSYTRYPHLGIDKSDKIHAFEIKAGVRF